MLPLVCPLCRIALPPVDDVCPRDGHPGRQVAWLTMPASLGQRFQVVEPFGHGDGGSLYIVDEPETGRRGLLKILSPAPKDQLAERQRLRRELVKQATLARTHLVVPLASGESEGFTWIFRDWLDGVALEVRLSREGALPQTEALAIAAQIATALDELHRGGLLHRDVKPGHIFLQPTSLGIPRALLLDAGVAKPISGDGATTIYGTAGYVAPEQLSGKLVSFRSDLYSLGCVLYRMLTGRPAFAGESLEQTLSVQRNGELPPTPADLPNGIGALLQAILSKDPQQRPFSAQKLRRTLDPFLPDGALMEKQPTTTFETVPTPSPSIAPQPSGTLKPPPPPALARPSMPAPPEGSMKPRLSSAPPPPPPSRQPIREENTQQIDIAQLQEIAQPKRSVPPPMPGAAKSSLPPPPPPAKAAQLNDRTQPIRLEQILQVADGRKAAQQPPKLEEPKWTEPRQAPPVFESKPELDAQAELDDKLDDEDLKPIDEDATGVFHPRHIAGAPRAAVSEPPARPQPPALFSAQDEPFSAPPPSTVLPGLGTPALFQPAPEPPISARSPEGALRQPLKSTAAPPPSIVPKTTMPAFRAPASMAPKAAVPQPAPIGAAAPVSTPAAFAPTLNAAAPAPFTAPAPASHADASSAEGFAKATLLGIGADPLETSTSFKLPTLPPVQGDATLRSHASSEYDDEELSPAGEREYETERVSLLTPPRPTPGDLDDSNLQDAFGYGAAAAGSIPSGPGATGQQRDSRRLLMYASAAVVGLAVLSVGASALRGKPEPVASPEAQTPPALPIAAAAEAPTAAAPAQAPRPTVHSLAPSTAQLAPAEPTTAAAEPVAAAAPVPAAPAPAASTAKLAPTAPLVEPIKNEPVLAPEDKKDEQDALASAHSSKHESKHGAHHEARERARAAKSSPADKSSDKTSDKAAIVAAARKEAGAAYAAKNYKAAAAAYERATRADPSQPGLFAGLGANLSQMGDNKGAIQAYQRAVKLSPDTSGFHAALGRVYLAAGDKSKSLSEYKRAVALDPDNEPAKLALKKF